MKIKEIQATGLMTVGAQSITISGSQIAIVEGDGEDQRVIALLGPANESATLLQAELMLRGLQGDKATPADQLLAIVRRERDGWAHVATSLRAVAEAMSATADLCASRSNSLAGVVEESEAGTHRPLIELPNRKIEVRK